MTNDAPMTDAQQKQTILLALLDTNDGGRGLAQVHLDPRHPEAHVPSRFVSQPTLALNLAYGFNLPALEVNKEGIYAVLSFGGRNFGCRLPWEAIYALTSPDDGHRGHLWPKSAPPELGDLSKCRWASDLREPAEPAVKPDPSPERPKLRVIQGGKQ
jgi:hypothetical protein